MLILFYYKIYDRQDLCTHLVNNVATAGEARNIFSNEKPLDHRYVDGWRTLSLRAEINQNNTEVR
jgi:hypothetical protein